MSHFSKVSTKLYDRKTLEKTLLDLNLNWVPSETNIRGYKGQVEKAEIVIRQNNNYDIGFRWNGKEYELTADLMFWDQNYSFEKFLNNIKQRYAYNLILNVGENQNFDFVTSESLANGATRVLLRKF